MEYIVSIFVKKEYDHMRFESLVNTYDYRNYRNETHVCSTYVKTLVYPQIYIEIGK